MTGHLSGLIALIYEAVDDDSLWPEVLTRVGNAISATQTLLFLTPPDSGVPDTLRCAGTSDEMVNSFLEYYASINILSEPCDRMFPDFSTRYSHLAVPDSQFENSEFYADFFHPFDMHYSMGLKFPFADGGQVYLSAQRPKRYDPFDPSEGEVYQMLLHHLRRALSIKARLRSKEVQVLGAEASLLAFEKATIGLTVTGAVCYLSEGAQQLLRAGEYVYVHNGQLHAREYTCDQKLQAYLRSLLSLDPMFLESRQSAILLYASSRTEPLRVVAIPQSGGPIAALLFLSPGGATPASRAAVLASLYRLSPTETRVADLLLAGMEVRQISEALRLTLETTRFHVKRILSKTGCRRQSELLKLMLEMPGMVSL